MTWWTRSPAYCWESRSCCIVWNSRTACWRWLFQTWNIWQFACSQYLSNIFARWHHRRLKVVNRCS